MHVCKWSCIAFCNNTLDDGASSSDNANDDTNTAGIVGGTVGGVVILILLAILCIIMCYVMHSYKKRESYSTGKPHFTAVSENHNTSSTFQLRYVYELESMQSNEENLGLEARLGKHVN